MTRRRIDTARTRGCIVAWALACAVPCVGMATADARTPAAVAETATIPAAARFALVIGNNQPERSGAARLRYADDDAVAIHKLMLEADVQSVLLSRLDEDTQRVHPLMVPSGPPRDGPFTVAVETLFKGIREAARRGMVTELLVFYSGHGDTSGGEGYVLLEDRRVMRHDLYDLLARSPAAHNHVFVDACKSYFFAFEKRAGGTRTSYTRSLVSADEPGRLTNVGFVLSTSSDRDSHEWERFQAGILSYELRSALRGAADVDEDGRVTYAELGAFLTRANQAIQNPRFRPDFLVRPPQKDLRREILQWQSRSRTAVHLLPRATAAHLYIENAHGERLLDAHAASAQPLSVHLPQERPLFVRRHDETSEYVLRTPAPTTIAGIDGGRLPAFAARGALHLAFEQLFAAPFGPRDVALFERQQNIELVARTSLPLESEERPLHGLRLTTAALGGAGLLAGLTLNALALQRYATAAGSSQVEIADSNRNIRQLNIAAAVCYVAAGVAGLAWSWLTWHPTTETP